MKIRSIRECSSEETVYDLSVKDTERFFVRAKNNRYGYLVHNSSMYPSTTIVFNIGPNTYKLQIVDPDSELINAKIYKYDKILSNQELLNKEVKVIVDPMTWYGGESYGKEIVTTYKEVFDIIDKYNYILSPNGACFIQHKAQESLFGIIFKEFRELRNEYRALLKQEKLKENYDPLLVDLLNRYQLAVKLLMNAGYGAIGAEMFTFHNKYVAESITLLGQHTIKNVVANLDYIIQNLEGLLEQTNIQPPR